MLEHVRLPLSAVTALLTLALAFSVRSPAVRVASVVDVRTSYTTWPYHCTTFWCVPPTPVAHPVHIRVVVVY